jgi:hypothetical protein
MRPKYSILIFVSVLTYLSVGCSEDKEPVKSVAEEQSEKLTGRWKVTSVILDNAALASFQETRFSIAALTPNTNLSYVIENNPLYSPWAAPSGGRLFFDAQEPSRYLLREDDIRIDYTVTATTLVMKFSYTAPAGRVGGVDGTWEFVLEKE